MHVITYNAPSSSITKQDFADMSYSSKMLLGLLPNMGLWMGCNVLTAEESSGYGLQWARLSENVYTAANHFSMADVFGILIIDLILYSILLWYMDGVRPGSFGIARKFYFPFQVRLAFELHGIFLT